MTFVFIVSYGLLFAAGLPKLLTPGYRRDLIAYIVLMSAGFIIVLMQLLGVEMPYIGAVIVDYFHSIFS